MWHSLHTLLSMDAIAAATVSHSATFPLLSVVRMTIDSKAMRKFKETDVLVGVIETADEIGTSVLKANMNVRLLSKLA